MLRRPASCCALVWLYLSVAANADWPQWRGVNRDDISTETGLLKEWPEGGPERVWMFEDCGIGYAGPAIVGERLYTMGGRNEGEDLICIDTSNGKELWSKRVGDLYSNDWGDGPRTTPTIDGEMIYALAAGGNLTCLKASDGEIVWSKSLTDFGGAVPNWGYAESPLIHENMLFCTPGGKEGAMVALDKHTGELIWQCKEVTDPAHYSSTVHMVHAGKNVAVQLLEKQLVGVDMADGKLLWSVPFQGRVAVIPTPIVKGNQVYATAGYGGGCLLVTIGDDKSAEVVYDNKVMSNHHGGVILLDDRIYGFSDNKGWTCQDFATGEKKWQEKEVFEKGAIAYADGRFYCLGEDSGEVVLIGATTAGWQEHGRFKLDPQSDLRKPKGKIWVHPVINAGRLYLRDQNLVYCYDIARKDLASRPTVDAATE